jgi:hypothetical protein
MTELWQNLPQLHFSICVFNDLAWFRASAAGPFRFNLGARRVAKYYFFILACTSLARKSRAKGRGPILSLAPSRGCQLVGCVGCAGRLNAGGMFRPGPAVLR